MIKRLCVLCVFGLIALPLVLNADPVKKRTEVTFNQPVEIPGMVLVPGAYAIKVPDPTTHPDMVGFYNTDDSHLYKLVRTIPAYRLDATDETAITFEERANGAPMAVKTWFYPGDNWGKEFVYGKANEVTVAEAMPAAPPPAPAPAVAEAPPVPEVAPEAVAETPETRVEIAELAPTPAIELAPATPPLEELPKTASFMPLFGLLGVLSLALGALMAWIPKGVANRAS